MKRITFAVLLLAATAAFGAGVKTDGLVVPQGSSTQILIPAAGSAAGANNQFFRSDITVFNYAAHDQRVRFQWLPAGQDGTNVPARELTIGARRGLASEDFVPAYIQQTGLGAILITPLTDTGALDISAKLFATCRIYSNPPNSEGGSVSQSFNSVPISAALNLKQSIVGLKHDERFRMSVGIVNLEPTTQTYQLTFLGTGGGQLDNVTVSVPPMSLLQVSAPGTAHVNMQVGVTSLTQGSKWLSFGSSVDNTTGDSWSELGFVQP
jgi:hypothetical protein